MNAGVFQAEGDYRVILEDLQFLEGPSPSTRQTASVFPLTIRRSTWLTRTGLEFGPTSCKRRAG